MKKIKLFLGLAVMGVMFFFGNSLAAVAEEGEEYLNFGSSEEAEKASQNEDGGEENASVNAGIVDDSFKEYEGEDPDPIPTLENATKQEIEPTDDSLADAAPERIAPKAALQQEKNDSQWKEDMPYVMIIIVSVVSIILLLIFAIRSNLRRK